MDFDKIVEEAEKAKREVTELCSKLIQFNTSHPKGITDECVGYIKNYFDQNKIDNEVHAIENTKPNIVAKLNGESDRTIL